MLFVERQFSPARLFLTASVFLFVSLSAGWVSSEEVKLLTWNVETGGNDPEVIAKQLRELHQTGGYDVYGLCEVDFVNARRYAETLGEDHKSIVSKTGRSDRLVLIWNSKRLDLTGQIGTRIIQRNTSERRATSPPVTTDR